MTCFPHYNNLFTATQPCHEYKCFQIWLRDGKVIRVVHKWEMWMDFLVLFCVSNEMFIVRVWWGWVVCFSWILLNVKLLTFTHFLLTMDGHSHSNECDWIPLLSFYCSISFMFCPAWFNCSIKPSPFPCWATNTTQNKEGTNLSNQRIYLYNHQPLQTTGMH